MKAKMIFVIIVLGISLCVIIFGENIDTPLQKSNIDIVTYTEIEGVGIHGIIDLYLKSLGGLPEKRHIEHGEFETPSGYESWSKKENAIFGEKIEKIMKTIEGKRWAVTGIPFDIGHYDIDNGYFNCRNLINVGQISIYSMPESEGIREVLNRTFIRTSSQTLNKSLGQFCQELSAIQALYIFIGSTKIDVEVEKARQMRQLSNSNQIALELIFQFNYNPNNPNRYYLTFSSSYLVDTETRKIVYEWKDSKICLAKKGSLADLIGGHIEIKLI